MSQVHQLLILQTIYCSYFVTLNKKMSNKKIKKLIKFFLFSVFVARRHDPLNRFAVNIKLNIFSSFFFSTAAVLHTRNVKKENFSLSLYARSRVCVCVSEELKDFFFCFGDAVQHVANKFFFTAKESQSFVRWLTCCHFPWENPRKIERKWAFRGKFTALPKRNWEYSIFHFGSVAFGCVVLAGQFLLL